jgi:phosphoribosylformylglycinamidine cyclo-ligase
MTERQYAAAGVDLAQAERAKHRISQAVSSTRTSLSLGEIGAFGGMVRVPAGMRRPVMVMSTDGVGTKVLVAQQAGRVGTVGEDLVNHSVNDILVHGARPVAFMDYVAGAGLSEDVLAEIVEGVARGCRNHDMALAGGETAQLPGLYQPGHFDLAGTIIGMVEEDEALHGDRIVEGDLLLGLASTGLHTNGYTLARHVLFEKARLTLDDELPGTDRAVADVLLAVHRSYAAALTPVLSLVHGMAHITGGGIGGNLVRILPPDVAAVVDPSTWPLPPLFAYLQRVGDISTAEMRDVFNLGVGLIVVLPREAEPPVRAAAEDAGIATWRIGRIVSGVPSVSFAD